MVGAGGGEWGSLWEKVLRKGDAAHRIESVDSGVAPADAREKPKGVRRSVLDWYL